jgi:hypothetical protein
MSMIARKRYPRLSLLLILSLPLLLWAWPIPAQAQCSGDNLSEASGYLVRDVKVETLFGRAPRRLKDILGKHRGERYRTTSDDFVISGSASGTSRTVYRREVENFFEQDSAVALDRLFGLTGQDSLYIRATYLTDCVTIVPEAECRATLKDGAGQPAPKCLDVSVRVTVLPINTGNLAANLLDLARSNKLRFYRELPRPLIAFNPSFRMEQDREYGTAMGGGVSTNLLSLPSALNGEPEPAQNTQLRLSASALKSLQESFYDTAMGLSLSHVRAAELLQKITFDSTFTAHRQPLGAGTVFTNAMHVGASTLIKPKEGILSQISLGAGYRLAGNRFFTRAGLPDELTSEQAFESRAIADGSIGRGFLRVGAWFDVASPESEPDYRRYAAMVGYSRDFFLPHWKCRVVADGNQERCLFPEKNGPAIGVEMLFGAGRAWGSVPEYARFYGGNSNSSFFYDAVDSPSVIGMPAGPLIRSYGRNQGGVETGGNAGRGGTSYWHYNLTASFPVPRLSRPLIPAELVIAQPGDSGRLSCSNCTSLKDLLKRQVGSGKNIFIDALAVQRLTSEQRNDLALDPDDGLTPEESARLASAEKAFARAREAVKPEADRLWSQLDPTVGYIADHANLYSVKPIVMFDAMRLSARGEPDYRTRLALGGGLQFNIVVAKFEVGYMRTIRHLPGDQRGNFVARMAFEKFF